MSYDDLKSMQEWDFNRKIQVSQTRILEWVIAHNGQVYISFSGGKDSCVLADLVARVWQVTCPDQTLDLVFSDTKMEYLDVIKHTEKFKNYLIDKYNINAQLVKIETKHNTHEIYKEIGYPILSKKIARQLRDLSNPTETNYYSRRLYTTGETKKGYYAPNYKLADKWIEKFNVDRTNYSVDLPFKVSEQCCDYFKKAPLRDYEKETGKKTFVGTMADNSRARANAWLKTGCNNFTSKNGQSKPMSFWVENDVLQYIKEFNIPISEVYGNIEQDEQGNYYTTGEHNTGCKYCVFGAHMEKGETRFERLKKLEPKSYEYAMREENGLGLKKVLDFLDIKH